MRQSFSYTLLITWVLFTISRKTHFVQKSYEIQNILVLKQAKSLVNTVVQLYLSSKAAFEKDMNRILPISKKTLTKQGTASLLTKFLGDLLLAEVAKEAEVMALDLNPSGTFFHNERQRIKPAQAEINLINTCKVMPFNNPKGLSEMEELPKHYNFVTIKS